MRTVGQAIKEARLAKKYSIEDLSEETRIKKEFIVAIEQGKWDRLPVGPVTTGFIKNLAASLGLDREKMIAMWRRDCPPTKGMINPKPDVQKRLGWGPRLTFILGVGGVLMLVVGYLGYQYYRFSRPPRLEIDFPRDGEVIRQSVITVVGKTDEEATVVVNNQPVYITSDGKFSEEIELTEGDSEISVRSSSRSGRETEVRVPIKVEFGI